MAVVLLGSVSSEAERLLMKYLDVYFPDTKVEPLQQRGIRMQIRNKVTNPDVLLAILDTNLYAQCEGTLDTILKMPKVHRYTNDTEFKAFLVSKFGSLDPGEAKASPAVDTNVVEDSYADEVLTVSDEFDTSNDHDSDNEIQRLNDELATKDMLIRNLEAQMEEKSSGDVTMFVERIRSLEAELNAAKDKVASAEQTSYADLGKIARAEQIIGDVERLRGELREEKSKGVELLAKNAELSGSVSTQRKELDTLRAEVSTLKVDSTNLSLLKKKFEVQSEELSSLKARIEVADKEVSELRARKKFLDTEVSRLTEQASELAVVKAKVERLEADKEKLLESTHQLASVKLRLDNLQVDYDKALSDNEQLTERNTELESDIIRRVEVERDLRTDISTVKAEKTGVMADLTEANEKVSALEKDLESLQKEKDGVSTLLDLEREASSKLSTEVGTLKEENGKMQLDVEAYTKKVSEVSAELGVKEAEISRLTKDIETKEKEYNSRIKSLNDQLDGVSGSADSKDAEIRRLNEDLENASCMLGNKDNEIDRLSSQIADMELAASDASKYSTEAGTLRAELAAEKAAKKLVEDELGAIKVTLAEKSTEYTELQEDKDSISAELKALRQELSDKAAEMSASELSVSEGVAKANAEIQQKAERITELESSIKTSSEKIGTLEAENKKLSNEVDMLRRSVGSEAELERKCNEAEEKLNDARTEVARLTAENDSLKNDIKNAAVDEGKNTEISELKVELSGYKDRLRSANAAAEEKSRKLESELAIVRERCASLEISVAERENEYRQKADSVYARLGTVAMPKSAFNLSVGSVQGLRNVYAVAAGSAESTLSVYQVVRRICSSINANVLFADFVTDSFVDREFGVEKVNSPVDFLQGAGPAQGIMSETKMKNVRVVSTAFSYFNSLSLLSVDWGTKLRELSAMANVVIVNVGCLSDVVSKVLFNTFSEAMPSHIIARGSPVNLRHVLLTLSGMPMAQSCKVSCVGFDNSASAMYQRIAQKYNIQILGDSDVLRL